jgi:hypothetical protein
MRFCEGAANWLAAPEGQNPVRPFEDLQVSSMNARTRANNGHPILRRNDLRAQAGLSHNVRISVTLASLPFRTLAVTLRTCARTAVQFNNG